MMHARLPPKQPQHPSVKPARGQHAPALLCKTSSASEHCVSAIVDREEATSRPMFSSGGMPRSNAVRKESLVRGGEGGLRLVQGGEGGQRLGADKTDSSLPCELWSRAKSWPTLTGASQKASGLMAEAAF